MARGQVSNGTKFVQFLKVLIVLIQLALTIFFIGFFEKSNIVLNYISLGIIGLSLLFHVFQFVLIKSKKANLKFEAFLTTVMVWLSLFKAIASFYFAVMSLMELFNPEASGLTKIPVFFITAVFLFLFSILLFSLGLRKIRKKREKAHLK